MSNRAWVTLATNDSYGLGALVLAHSLRRAGSSYPTVVLITPSVTEAMSNRLRAVYADVVTVNVLDSRDAAHLALLQRPELGITFTKIHCWSLTQYEKCVFLDADTLVVQNCDELFEREELSAAPDVGWPDCFNSGVFVFRPSADTFNELIKFAQERGSFDGGDQGLLNSFFSDWAHGDINKHLPFLYNVTSAAFYSYLPALKHYGQNLKIIHFIGSVKPWLQQYNWESRTVGAPDHLRELLQLWWDIFVSQVHCQLDTTMSGVAGNLARVVPGSGLQREALDELTRRQGWEAGNIDYMGADSFDNIWAKISQTLSQPRSSPPKQSPPKELAPAQPAVQPVEVAKKAGSGEAPVIEDLAVVEAPVPVQSVIPIETPASVEEPASAAVIADETATAPEAPIAAPAPTPIPIEVPVEIPACVEETIVAETPTPSEIPKTVEAIVESSPQAPNTPRVTKDETDLVELPQKPLSDASNPSAAEIVAPASPVVEVEPVTPAAKAAPSSPAPATKAPASPAISEKKATPEKPAVAATTTDSPPLANTPSKEEAPAEPAAKSVERRKPAGKLQLRPPVTADPLPTPDSELEDAASLAQSIIASELRTPTVTSPEPATAAAAVISPALTSSAPAAPASAQEKRLTVEEPEVPTPPVGGVSLAQIGVKPTPKGKASTAAQIESSVSPQSPTETSAPAAAAVAAAPAEVPKKKIVKKVVKKEGATSGEAPVPPPRKKEKKPKEK